LAAVPARVRSAAGGPRRAHLTVIAKELSISESCLRIWLAQDDADVSRSNSSRLTSEEKRELAELRKKARPSRSVPQEHADPPVNMTS